MIDSKKILNYIKTEINPYGKPFKGTVFEFGIKIMEYITAMEKQPKVEWILCSEKMPEERDSIFAKVKGTDRWNNVMFEKISDEVQVTAEFKDGSRKTMISHTIDGKWRKNNTLGEYRIIAWMPLQEPHIP